MFIFRRFSGATLAVGAVLLNAGCAATPPVNAAAPVSAPGTALPLKHAPRPTVPEITAGDLMTRLYIVADDSMMGRAAGHPGNVMATTYIAGEFSRMGLEPAGEGGTFFQTVPMVRRALDETAAISVGGVALRLGTDYVIRDQGPGARSLDGAKVVYAGTWGDEANLVPAGVAAGRLVVVGVLPGPDGTMPWNVRRQVLARYPDAAGIAIASLEAVPAEIQAALREPTLGVAGEPTPGPSLLWVTRNAAAKLLGRTLSGIQPGAQGSTVAGTVRYTQTAADPARNVVAILRGSDPAVKQQYVGISAHNDHEGIATRPVDHDSAVAFNTVMRPQGANDPVRRPTQQQWTRIRQLRDSLTAAHGGPRLDSIFNGADDDGSGTVTLLEIAQELAAGPTRPRRSILFISHTAEEGGLLGSQWYSENPTVPRDSIVAVLNMDMVGHGRAEEVKGGGPYSLQMIGSRRLSTQLGDLIDTLNARRQRPMDIDYSWDAPGHPSQRYCRSDHFMYARFGIPITYLSLGYHPHYHMVTDEPQYIDYEHMERVAEFVRDVALEVANRPTRLLVDGPKQDPRAPCRQ